MTQPPPFSPRVWLVDPISYSGMAYSDVGQINALRELGARPVLVGSDTWMLDDRIVPRMAVFRGTAGGRSRMRRGLAYIVSLIRLLRRVRAARPDVVHWQFTELPVADVLAMVAVRRLGVPQAFTAHELVPWTASRHHQWLFSRLYALIDGIVVHSDAKRAELVDRFGVSPAKVHVAPLGDYVLFATPELPQAEARSRLGLTVEGQVVLFFGTIRPSKGLDVLLQAWAVAAPKIPDARLLIVGKPYKGLRIETIHEQIERLGIGARIEMRFEQVDPATANACYRAADVVVLPYREIGTSGVLRYAYNSARPVIATAVGEHATHVIPGRTGHLVPPGNHVALATALATALADPSALRAMGDSSRAYAAENFRWLDSAVELLRVYEGLVRKA